MTPELYQRLKPLYENALDLSSEKRAAFVDEICKGDTQLKKELQDLLAAHDDETGTLDKPLIDLHTLKSPRGQTFPDGTVLLGRFRILRFIDAGGMGEVYEAEDTFLPHARIAIKTIHPSIAKNPESLARFKDEIMLARQVRGANVCRIYEFHVYSSPGKEDIAFLTMEYLEGVTLKGRIKIDGPLPPKEAMKIALQLCEALKSIHEAGIVHRDLKPANIMLAPRNGVEQAVLMDFGLAQALEPDPSNAETIEAVPRGIAGTADYMAPEQFDVGGQISPATDIYALGVVLYEMVTGVVPFPSTNLLAAAMRRARPPAPPSILRRELRPVWDDVILRCLQYESARRFQSASEISEALHLIVWSLPRGQRIALTPRVAIGSAAVLLLLLSIAGWSFYHWITLYRPPAEAKRAYDYGVAALRDGTYLTAANSLSEAVSRDPRYALAYARLAEAWAKLDSTGQATLQMLKATTAEQQVSLRDQDKRYIEAVQHTLVRDYSAAAQDYEDILRHLHGEDKADGLVDLGRAYEKAGKINETVASYEQAARLRPDDPAPYVHLGIWKSRQRDPAGAEAAFTRAEELYRAKSNQEGLAEVAYQRGYAANEASNSTRAHQYLGESLDIARQIRSPQLEARTLSQLSSIEYNTGNEDQGIAYANQAIKIAEDNDLEYWHADGEMRLGNAYLEKGDFALAEFHSNAALRLARKYEHPRLIANAAFTLASLRDQQGTQCKEQIVLAKEALDYFRDFGFMNSAAKASTLIVSGELCAGYLERARKDSVELIHTAEETHSDISLELAEDMAGSVSFAQEDYVGALGHYDRALKLSRLTHQYEAIQEISCADAYWQLGRYDEATHALDQIPKETKRRSDMALAIDGDQAPMFLSQGKYVDAITESSDALNNIPALSVQQVADLRRVRALAEERLGQLKMAHLDGDELMKLGRERSDDGIVAEANIVNAEFLLQEHHPEKARPMLISANHYFSDMGMKESQWTTYVLLAEAAKASGDATDCSENAKRAREILDSLKQSWGETNFAQYAARPDHRREVQQLSKIS